MNQEERADWLARAIDDLLRGVTPPKTQEPTDEDLQSLLHVARARLEVSSQTARAAADYENDVWQQLVARIEARASRAGATDQTLVPAEEDALRETVTDRRKFSRNLSETAEQHRDDVWLRIQRRIGKGGSPSLPERLFSWLRGPQRWPEETPPPSRTRLVPTGDADVDGLIRVALARPHRLRLQAAAEMDEGQAGLRRRMRTDPARREAPPALAVVEPSGLWWPTAALGAGILVLLAAVGPLATSGFGRHPAVQAFEYVAHHAGIA